MSRWICIDDICIPSDENDWEELVAFADAIAEQEPIDIVRCGECKYWRAYETWSVCELWTGDPYEAANTNADDFCSYGSRSEKPNNSKERSSE